jgi:hypothetical protein
MAVACLLSYYNSSVNIYKCVADPFKFQGLKVVLTLVRRHSRQKTVESGAALPLLDGSAFYGAKHTYCMARSTEQPID